jgi:ATP-dependent Clp protease protease subunit
MASSKKTKPFISPTIYFFGEINDKSSKEFMQELAMADSMNSMITVIINSGGGDVDAAIACYDSIKSTRNTVLTVGSGLVASAAILPFLAGDVRLMQMNCRMFFHEVRAGQEGKDGFTSREMTKLTKETEAVESVYYRIVSECSDLKVSTVEALCQKETYVDIEEALKHGFIESEYGHTQTKNHNNSTPLERAVNKLKRK